MAENKKESKKVEMKAGLEIHQQLDTHKLFCNCPSILRNDKPDFTFKRKLHAVAGESGEVDLAAKHEKSKDKEFIYEAYRDTTCLLEYDEIPPYNINQEALRIALQIACLLNCEIIQDTQVMRKTVIDGSNTSGFQRTLLLAKNGFIETSFGKVGIASICLEEDAARIVEHKENEKQTIYRLDRLGIPLIEIATAPEIYYAEQVKEAALKLGEILRACKVKRGIGTIRQDINISIPKHERVEIKGFQDPAMMIKTVELEIARQKTEGKNGKSEVRKSNEDGSTSFLRPMPGADRMYPETDLSLLHISRDLINEVKNSLPKLRGEIKGELIEKGLNEEMIKLVLESRRLEDFESLLEIYNTDNSDNCITNTSELSVCPILKKCAPTNRIDHNSNFIAKLMFVFPKEIASHEKISSEIFNMDVLEGVVRAIVEGKIKEEDAKHVLEQIGKGKNIDEAIKTMAMEKVDLSAIETEAAKLIKEKPGLSVGAYMGLIMARFKGKIDGKSVMEILKKLVK